MSFQIDLLIHAANVLYLVWSGIALGTAAATALAFYPERPWPYREGNPQGIRSRGAHRDGGGNHDPGSLPQWTPLFRRSRRCGLWSPHSSRRTRQVRSVSEREHLVACRLFVRLAAHHYICLKVSFSGRPGQCTMVGHPLSREHPDCSANAVKGRVPAQVYSEGCPLSAQSRRKPVQRTRPLLGGSADTTFCGAHVTF